MAATSDYTRLTNFPISYFLSANFLCFVQIKVARRQQTHKEIHFKFNLRLECRIPMYMTYHLNQSISFHMSQTRMRKIYCSKIDNITRLVLSQALTNTHKHIPIIFFSLLSLLWTLFCYQERGARNKTIASIVQVCQRNEISLRNFLHFVHTHTHDSWLLLSISWNGRRRNIHNNLMHASQCSRQVFL